MQKNTEENCLIQVIKELKDCLFLFIIIQQEIITFLSILPKNIFFQELELKIKTFKMMEEIFMISQLMTRLSNMTKSQKHQQDKMMITRLGVCWILLILKKNYRLTTADLSKQKALNADSRAAEQISFTGKKNQQ